MGEALQHASPVQCHNRRGEAFQCAAGDSCCGDVCVASGDVCCANVEGNVFPCQGTGGQCCGNACAAPGSKCCRSPHVERSRWYPVSRNTTCAFEESSLFAVRSEVNSEALQPASPVQCHNRRGEALQCAAGDRCCGDVCVAAGDVCCVNVNGNNFPCQGKGGQCCGNACAAPGSKCCRSPHVDRSRWYPVSNDTECAFDRGSLVPAVQWNGSSYVPCHNRRGEAFQCAAGDR